MCITIQLRGKWGMNDNTDVAFRQLCTGGVFYFSFSNGVQNGRHVTTQGNGRHVDGSCLSSPCIWWQRTKDRVTKVTWDEIALCTDSTVRVIYRRGREAVISIGAVFKSTSIKMLIVLPRTWELLVYRCLNCPVCLWLGCFEVLIHLNGLDQTGS